MGNVGEFESHKIQMHQLLDTPVSQISPFSLSKDQVKDGGFDCWCFES